MDAFSEITGPSAVNIIASTAISLEESISNDTSLDMSNICYMDTLSCPELNGILSPSEVLQSSTYYVSGFEEAFPMLDPHEDKILE